MEKKVEMKDIFGYEGEYAVTRDGRVWSHSRIITKKDPRGVVRNYKWGGKWLKSNTTRKGDWYMSISFRKTNRKGFKVHRLVAQAYIPNPLNLPEVNHKNGIKTDNRVENLEWCNRKQNIEHGKIISPTEQRAFRRGSENHWAKLSEKSVSNIKRQYAKGKTSHGKLAKKYLVSTNTIGTIIRGIVWKHVKI